MQATLAHVHHAGNRLNINCDGCGKCRQVDPAGLIGRLGDAFPIPRLKSVLSCQLCGAKQADLKIAINMKPFELPGSSTFLGIDAISV